MMPDTSDGCGKPHSFSDKGLLYSKLCVLCEKLRVLCGKKQDQPQSTRRKTRKVRKVEVFWLGKTNHYRLMLMFANDLADGYD